MQNNSTATYMGLSGPWRAILISLFSLLTIATIMGNLLVLVAVVRFHHRMHAVMSIFISSLASADLLIGTVEMPLTAMQIIEGSWPLNRQACNFRFAIDVTSITASINSLAVIAIDRYLAVTRPLQYPSLVTKRRASYAVIAVWMLSVGQSFLPINLGWYRSKTPNALACYNNPRCCSLMANKEYIMFAGSLTFYVPATIMIIVYSRVLKEANLQVSTMLSFAVSK